MLTFQRVDIKRRAKRNSPNPACCGSRMSCVKRSHTHKATQFQHVRTSARSVNLAMLTMRARAECGSGDLCVCVCVVGVSWMPLWPPDSGESRRPSDPFNSYRVLCELFVCMYKTHVRKLAGFGIPASSLHRRHFVTTSKAIFVISLLGTFG